LLLSERTFPGTGDLARRWQTGFGESLLRGEVVIFNKRLTIVVMKFAEEPVLEKTNLVFSGLYGNGLEF
jgi:hypothetical protein